MGTLTLWTETYYKIIGSQGTDGTPGLKGSKGDQGLAGKTNNIL